jgi:hypothetical protein
LCLPLTQGSRNPSPVSKGAWALYIRTTLTWCLLFLFSSLNPWFLHDSAWGSFIWLCLGLVNSGELSISGIILHKERCAFSFLLCITRGGKEPGSLA